MYYLLLLLWFCRFTGLCGFAMILVIGHLSHGSTYLYVSTAHSVSGGDSDPPSQVRKVLADQWKRSHARAHSSYSSWRALAFLGYFLETRSQSDVSWFDTQGGKKNRDFRWHTQTFTYIHPLHTLRTSCESLKWRSFLSCSLLVEFLTFLCCEHCGHCEHFARQMPHQSKAKSTETCHTCDILRYLAISCDTWAVRSLEFRTPEPPEPTEPRTSQVLLWHGHGLEPPKAT